MTRQTDQTTDQQTDTRGHSKVTIQIFKNTRILWLVVDVPYWWSNLLCSCSIKPSVINHFKNFIYESTPILFLVDLDFLFYRQEKENRGEQLRFQQFYLARWLPHQSWRTLIWLIIALVKTCYSTIAKDFHFPILLCSCSHSPYETTMQAD